VRKVNSLELQTLPASAGMFIELVAKPMAKAIADSTPRNDATSFSNSSCLSRLPKQITEINQLMQANTHVL